MCCCNERPRLERDKLGCVMKNEHLKACVPNPRSVAFLEISNVVFFFFFFSKHSRLFAILRTYHDQKQTPGTELLDFGRGGGLRFVVAYQKKKKKYHSVQKWNFLERGKKKIHHGLAS